MPRDDYRDQLACAAALAEPARRALYEYVVSHRDPVSRDQAAAGTGLARHTAKFHLDRLVNEGLLETEFRRLSGRTGPGAGRPAKLYRRSAREVDVSVPPRQYELAGRVLAEAVSTAAAEGVAPLDAVRRSARDTGRRLAQPWSGDGDPLDALGQLLATYGYEPRPADDHLALRNCPFHRLAADYPELVCGMNHAMLAELTDTVTGGTCSAHLEPAPGQCCVTIRRDKD